MQTPTALHMEVVTMPQHNPTDNLAGLSTYTSLLVKQKVRGWLEVCCNFERENKVFL